MTDGGAAGSSLSVSKSDGSTFLVVWNEPRMWDPKLNAPVAPVADPVTIDFGARYSYKVYDPLAGLTPLKEGRGPGVRVSLRGSPLLIRVVPGSAP